MNGKGLFPIVESGYDVREADAYIAFLLAEYNKAMERIAILEQSQNQDKGMDEAEKVRQDENLEELQELRSRFQQMSEQIEKSNEREQELKDKIFNLRQDKSAIERQLQEAGEQANPTVEHTAKIIAEILIQAREGGEKIIAKATQQAEEIMEQAKEKATDFETDALEKAKHAREVFAESQRKIQEAYNFLQSFPSDFTV